MPLHVFEPRYRAMINDCLAAEGDGEFGVVLISRGWEVGGGDHRVGVGTVARIVGGSVFDDGRRLLVTQGAGRFRVDHWLDEDPYPSALVGLLPEAPGPERPGSDVTGVEWLRPAILAVRRCRALLSELGQAPPMPDALLLGAEPAGQLWRLCAAAPCNSLDAQRLLEIDDPLVRAAALAALADDLADDLMRLLAEHQ